MTIKKNHVFLIIVVGCILGYMAYRMRIKEAASICIIGGADGPTAVYLSANALSTLTVIVCSILLLVIVGIAFIINRKHKKR